MMMCERLTSAQLRMVEGASNTLSKFRWVRIASRATLASLVVWA